MKLVSSHHKGWITWKDYKAIEMGDWAVTTSTYKNTPSSNWLIRLKAKELLGSKQKKKRINYTR